MKPETFRYDRLVKGEDLNHHQTLFAGRCAEWFVEAGFIAAAGALPAENIVCLKIHGLSFTEPLFPGDIARFESRIVHTGRTSFKVYVSLSTHKKTAPIVKGFITFVHVNRDGRAVPHGLSLELEDSIDIALNAQAVSLST